jgi:hypothetical protein
MKLWTEVLLILMGAIVLQETNHHLLLLLVQKERKKGNIRNWSTMRGIFWNSNGLRDPKKDKFISDLIKEYDLSFIALSEMGRSEFMPRFLKNLCGGRGFLWHCKAPHGQSGGMLLGVDLQFFDIGLVEEGEHFFKFRLCNKSNSFKWALVLVYGPAQPVHKDFFWLN